MKIVKWSVLVVVIVALLSPAMAFVNMLKTGMTK